MKPSQTPMPKKIMSSLIPKCTGALAADSIAALTLVNSSTNATSTAAVMAMPRSRAGIYSARSAPTAEPSVTDGSTRSAIRHGIWLARWNVPVAVLAHVVLAFEAEPSRLAALHLAPVASEILPADHLGADETALDVAVDLPGRLDGGRAATDRPGATLVLARGEEADQIEERVAGADEAVPGARLEPQVGEEGRAVSGLELRELRLDGRGEDETLRALGACARGDVGRERASRLRLRDVHHDEQGLE